MKKERRLIWTLYPSYLLITLISMAAVYWYATDSLGHFFIENTASNLMTRGKLLSRQITPHLSPPNQPVIHDICREIGKTAATRITVILPNGSVVGDSEGNPANMDNHKTRPEFLEALSTSHGRSVRYSRTLGSRMMYVATPLTGNDGNVLAVLRVSLPLVSVDQELRSIRTKIAFGGMLIAMLAAAICMYVSRRISRPLEEMRKGAERFSAGDLEHRLHAPPNREMAGLAESLNQMAVQLRERIKTVTDQRNEIEAVLTSMSEGIIAVDPDERILSMNLAAVNMLKSYSQDKKGRSIQEVIRNRELNRFIQETLLNKKTMNGDILLHYDNPLVLNVICTPLYGSEKNLIGALMVLNDVTQLRHLEKVRSDFVANVSHEIKTPLTAIKGFVETLRTGAMDQPEEAERFLGIIEKHVDRLSAIVEDLLQLSRLEQEDGYSQIRLEEIDIRDVIQASVQVCHPKAKAKQIKLETACDPGLKARVDPRLLEQVFVNLLDNAIKYSEDQSIVRVRAQRTDSEIIVGFQDYGIGIPQKHLLRLFERFYRVDPARSRKMGGTGLGLSIVKHIINAHGGHVLVESTPGKGSTFTVHLPLPNRSGTSAGVTGPDN